MERSLRIIASANAWDKGRRISEPVSRKRRPGGTPMWRRFGALQEALGSVDRLGWRSEYSRYPDLISAPSQSVPFSRSVYPTSWSCSVRNDSACPNDRPLLFSCSRKRIASSGIARSRFTTRTGPVEEPTRGGDDPTLGKAHPSWPEKRYWFGEPLRGIEHAREAVILLQGPEERTWLRHSVLASRTPLRPDGGIRLRVAGEACAHDIAATIDDRRFRVRGLDDRRSQRFEGTGKCHRDMQARARAVDRSFSHRYALGSWERPIWRTGTLCKRSLPGAVGRRN